MLEQEGVKPRLALVVDNASADLDYPQMLAEAIKRLQSQKLAGEKPDVMGALSHLDPDEDNSAIRDWLSLNNIMPKPAFDRTLAKMAKNRAVEAALGFVPKDPLDFVARYATSQGVILNARGTISRQRSYTIGDAVVDASNRDISEDTRLVYDVANAEGDNLDSFGRDLRLLTDRLNLGYRDSVISDAIQTWQEECTRDLKVNAMLSVKFEKGKATGPAGQAMWEAMEAACFDVRETLPGFAIAVMKKFIWQVKRKARGITVTNHLMPVLTGAQGKGKTEFVKAMTRPLHDLMREVDFGLITDGKTADIWSALILFIDEMGSFTKADVDTVKNVITSTERPIRTMRTNHSTQVRNQATLIGCTNKSLGQLIRDETGGRRFAELMWRNDPDWEASNALDWIMLWQSVDENGPDPIIAANMMDTLKEQQEANRNQSPVEVWVRQFGHTMRQWSKASDIHDEYRTWERDAFPNHSTSQAAFGKELTSLIRTMPDFPLEKRTTNSGVQYRHATKVV